MSQVKATARAGTVRGETLRYGIVFKGIPFAAPPVGVRRFRPPEPVSPWQGVRDATTFGPACPQRGTSLPWPFLRKSTEIPVPMDEDCLYLNVWTPAADDAHRPTMVWIHGGAFANGTGAAWPFDGTSFIRDNIVLITINYRLGPFGFLYLDDLFDGVRHTGNLGLLDQIAALQWVRDNIAAFGGEPDNVTVFGESAGAMSIVTLLGMPSAHGLFRRAILQSGGQIYHTTEVARSVAQDVLAQVGVRTGDWDGLAAVPTQQLVEANPPRPEFPPFPFLPVLDGITLPDAPTRLIAGGNASEVELIVGCTTDEWRLLHFSLPPGALPAPNLATLFAASGASTDEIYAAYTKASVGAMERDVYAAIQTDQLFTIPITRIAETQLRHIHRVWMYRFDWSAPILEGILGAFHSLDVPFTFEHYDDPDLLGDDPPQQLGSAMHGAWVRFATSGDPNGGILPQWPCYDLQQRQVLLFNTPCTVVEDPRAEIRQFWEHVI
jgi:para-nitrobenzyl esterase